MSEVPLYRGGMLSAYVSVITTEKHTRHFLQGYHSQESTLFPRTFIRT